MAWCKKKRDVVEEILVIKLKVQKFHPKRSEFSTGFNHPGLDNRNKYFQQRILKAFNVGCGCLALRAMIISYYKLIINSLYGREIKKNNE